MTRSLFILLTAFLFVSAGISQDTLFLKPGPEEGKDAWIDTHYTSFNWGHHEDLSCCAWTSGGVPGVTRGLIEFDLSQIPENATILEARLSLYANTTTNQSHIHSNLSGHNDGFISRVIEPWDEKTVLWGNQPSFDPDNQGYLHESNYEWEDYPDIEISELIRDSYNDPENSHGMLIHLRTEIYYRALVFCSSDHENPEKWPELEVVYEICEPPSAVFGYSADDHTVSFNPQDTSITEWLIPALLNGSGISAMGFFPPFRIPVMFLKATVLTMCAFRLPMNAERQSIATASPFAMSVLPSSNLKQMRWKSHFQIFQQTGTTCSGISAMGSVR